MWKKKVLSVILIGSLSICPVSLAFAAEDAKKNENETKNSGQSEITLVVEDTSTVSESHEETDKTHPIRVIDQPHGTVQLSSETAQKGEKVVAMIAVDAGYRISDVVIASKEKKDIVVNQAGEGKYEFEMPDGEVTIIATFAKGKKEDPNHTPIPDDPNNKPADISQKPPTDTDLNTNTEKPDPSPESNPTAPNSSAEEGNNGNAPANPPVNDTHSDTNSEKPSENAENKEDPPVQPDEPNWPSQPSQPEQPSNPKPTPVTPSRPSSNKDDDKPAKTDHSTGTSGKPTSNDDKKPEDSTGNPAKTDDDNPTTDPDKKPQITIIGGGHNTRVPPKTSGNQDTGGIPATDIPEVPKANVPGVRVMSVFAPITMPVTVAKDGTVVVANEAAIQSNVTKGDIEVEEVNIKLADGWKAVADDAELKKNQMRLSLREDQWDRFGKLKLTDKNWTVKPIEKLPLNMKVELPEDCVLTETEPVKIEFVFDWSET